MTRPEAMTLCREMYGRWTAEQVRAYLAEHSVLISETTVKRWGDPAYYEARRVRDRDTARRRRQTLRAYERMVTLRERGLTFNAIAIVLSVDLGVEVDAEQVRYSLRTGRPSRSIAKAVSS
jgi:hypothetical protein